MILNIEDFIKNLSENNDFVSCTNYFDGIINLEIDSFSVWIKIFMGKVIEASSVAFPFGYTFAVKGSAKGWKFALDSKKNRFREALYKGEIKIDGNTLEYNRIAKAVHGIIEILRKMVIKKEIRIGE